MKKGGNLFYSIAGLIILFIIIITVNIISSVFHTRVDMTEDHLYTLSKNSEKILAKLDTPVTIRYYFSKSSPTMPLFLKNYAERVEDLLYEYKQAGHGKIIIKKYDPAPDSDAEDSALMDGIKAQMLNTGDKIYLGLAVSCLDKTVAIPFLSPDRENLLEYDITHAITQVISSKKPVIGVMSALPVMGESPSPAMMQMGQFQMKKPWLIFKELKKDYEVRKIPLTAEEIDDDIDLLFVVHPAGITDKTQFALDQYVLKGGKMVVFLDPMSFYAQSHTKGRRNFGMMAKTSSNLDKLLKAWKIEYDASKVLGDMVFGKHFRTPQREVKFVCAIDITKKGFNKNDIIASQLNKITMVFPGGFSGIPATGLKKTVLMHSTEEAGFVNPFMANNPELSFKEFKPTGKVYDLAIALSGKFKTAFPDGKPEDKKEDEKNNKNEKKDKSAEKYLKESVKDGYVLLIADSDIAFDDICVQKTQFFGQQLLIPMNDNLNFIQNIADSLAGDSDLIGIRCRQKISRPFEVVNEIRAKAEKQYKEKVLALEKELRETEQRLNELQRAKGKSKDQRFILSPEQQEELKKFQIKRAEVRKDLKKVRKQLRKDINSLENTLKWINIALMPLCVIIFGIIIAINRKRRSAAK